MSIYPVLVGATGPQGIQGVAGTNGTSPYKGTWSNSVAYSVGDLVVHSSVLYYCILGGYTAATPNASPSVWAKAVGTNGNNGAAGADGADGADGATWYRDAGTPSSGLGVDFDFYLDSSSYEIYQKGTITTGVWSSIGNIKGTDGIDGVSFNWRGPFNNSESEVYDLNDVVSDVGSSYVCILGYTLGGSEPSAWQDSTHWQLLASQGDAGNDGSQGPTGPGFTYQGTWAGSTGIVNVGDVYTDSTASNNLYVCTTGFSGQTAYPSSSGNFALYLTNGPVGPTGPIGATGPSGGPTGPQGPTGPAGPGIDIIGGSTGAIPQNSGGVYGPVYVITDTSAVNSIDPTNRVLITTSAAETLNWNNQTLYDSSNVTSADWTNRYLYSVDTSNTYVAVDWNLNQLYSWTFEPSLSLDWKNKCLYNDSSTIVLNYNNTTLNTSGGVLSLDWTSHVLVDSFAFNSLNWDSRVLLDSSTVSSVDWNNRQLLANDGATVVVDWASTTGPTIAYDPTATTSYWLSGSSQPTHMKEAIDRIVTALYGLVGSPI